MEHSKITTVSPLEMNPGDNHEEVVLSVRSDRIYLCGNTDSHRFGNAAAQHTHQRHRRR